MELRPAVTSGERQARKAVIGAAIGNFVEWYDFSVYAYFAVVIGAQFFPSENQSASVLAAFATFGVAFLVRPLGALIFGHYGDRLGRRNTLAAVVLLMATATTVIGLLPNYAVLGPIAPAILVLARAAQGFSAGGEYASASSYLVELAPEGKRGSYGGWTYFSVGLGLVAGALAGVLASAVLPAEAVAAWGWRIPFLLAVPLGAISFYIRLRLEDSPKFREVAEQEELAAAPLLDVLRVHGRTLLITIGLVLVGTIGTYVVLLYMPTYMTTAVGLDMSTALLINFAGLVLFTATVPPLARWTDRIGRKPVLFAAAIAPLLLAYPAFRLVSSGITTNVLTGQCLLALCVALWAGAAPTTLVELFPTAVRTSALGIGYSVTVSVFGGFSPLLISYLTTITSGVLAPALVLIAGAVASLLATCFLRETANRPLPHTGRGT